MPIPATRSWFMAQVVIETVYMIVIGSSLGELSWTYLWKREGFLSWPLDVAQEMLDSIQTYINPINHPEFHQCYSQSHRLSDCPRVKTSHFQPYTTICVSPSFLPLPFSSACLLLASTVNTPVAQVVRISPFYNWQPHTYDTRASKHRDAVWSQR